MKITRVGAHAIAFSKTKVVDAGAQALAFSKQVLRIAQIVEWFSDHPKTRKYFILFTIYAYGLAISRIIDLIRSTQWDLDKLIPLYHEFIH